MLIILIDKPIHRVIDLQHDNIVRHRIVMLKILHTRLEDVVVVTLAVVVVTLAVAVAVAVVVVVVVVVEIIFPALTSLHGTLHHSNSRLMLCRQNVRHIARLVASMLRITLQQLAQNCIR